MEKLKIGDAVTAINDTRLMFVESISGDTVICTWYEQIDSSKIDREIYNKNSIEKHDFQKSEKLLEELLDF